MQNPFENAIRQLERATAVKSFPKEFIETLKRPDNEIEAVLTVRMDDGSEKKFDAYRVQYNNFRGPYKGGIRYHENADINEVRTLAFLMALKCAVANIPMGGGKGGVAVNPRDLSKGEIEKLSREWVRVFYKNLGPQKDVPAPDVNTTSEIMDWMNDEYTKLTGDSSGATFTGKSIGKGGSEGRSAATGKGGFYVFDALRGKLALPEVCKVVIQGFGNVGSYAAKLWFEAGHKIIAVSDYKGGVFNGDGINIPELIKYRDVAGSVVGFEGAKALTNKDLLEIECDVLIPAALENQITAENVQSIRAGVVFELANGPTTPEADDILLARHIPVVPDILANSGGVTVSTFEWEQNLKNEHWKEEDVFKKLKEAMEREALNVYEKSKELGTDLRRAAFVIALERILAAKNK